MRIEGVVNESVKVGDQTQALNANHARVVPTTRVECQPRACSVNHARVVSTTRVKHHKHEN